MLVNNIKIYTFLAKDTAKVVDGSKGFVDYINHLNERRPELVQAFFHN